MKKRWLIRSIFIGLLTLCIVAWVGSYWRGVTMEHNGNERVIFALGDGRIGILQFMPIGREGWGFFSVLPRDFSWTNWDEIATYHGRHFGSGWWVKIPLWLPTLLSALLLWFIWRRTRPKPRGVSGGSGGTEDGRKAGMIRRWVNRGLVLALLTLCVEAWVGSGVYEWHVRFDWFGCGMNWGTVYVSIGRLDMRDLPPWDGFRVYPELAPPSTRAGGDFLGFGFHRFSSIRSDVRRFTVPFWFLTASSALLLVLVWRKPRAMPVGGAFPVEPARAGEKQP